VLPGSAEAEFGAQRATANEQYMEGMGNINFAAANAGIQQNRTLADQADQWGQQRDAFQPAFAARGILGSGLYRRDLGRATSQYMQLHNRTIQDYARQGAGFNLQRTNLENRHAVAISNLRNKHAAVLGDAAARSVK
jgi:hypothetical protein